MKKQVNADVVVIGGGIAGLWLFRKLNLSGYKAVLLENNALGGDQTIKSQGIIHGGTKYTLSGSLTKASQCIAGMPDRWRKALAGKEQVNLSGTKILSNYQYLWSPGGLGSRLTSFFASKALRGRVDSLKPEQYPAIFQHQGFKGTVYQLNEVVLDVSSVINVLVAGLEHRCIKIDWNSNAKIIANHRTIEGIDIHQGNELFHLKAKRYVTTAGSGTADLIAQWGLVKPQMQVRPLHMVMVKHGYPEPIFAHCIGAKRVPRITITTHPTAAKQWVWYLGGEIAEEGVKYSSEALINIAKQELAALLPWANMGGAKWSTLRVNRAEPKQSSVLRPDAAFCQQVNNSIVTWPTKLTLAPNLTDEVIKILAKSGVEPSGNETFSLPENCACPKILPPFWSSYFD